MSNEKLLEYRKKIDVVDDKILQLLRERMSYVREIGHIKAKETRGCVIRPAREAEMTRRIVEAGRDILPPEFMARLWRTIIAGSTSLEQPQTISVYATEKNMLGLASAREYFGPFVATLPQQNPQHVIYDVVGKKATVGLLPIATEDKAAPWWVQLTGIVNAPKVFAYVPFVDKATDAKPFFALGDVEPEKTSDDVTMLVIEEAKSLSRETISKQCEKIGHKGDEMARYEELDREGKRYHLYALNGFVAHGSSELKDLHENLKKFSAAEAPIKLYVLGAYAKPIVIV